MTMPSLKNLDGLLKFAGEFRIKMIAKSGNLNFEFRVQKQKTEMINTNTGRSYFMYHTFHSYAASFRP